MSIINFIKMQGCGNDFVVIYTKFYPGIVFSVDLIRKITDRRYGIGCDQLILIEDSKVADCFMRIYNADGSEAGACGNASRCIARLFATEHNKSKIHIETITNTLTAYMHHNGLVTIDMGKPKFSKANLNLLWEVEPLSLQMKIDHMNIESAAVNVGNVHLICFFDYNIDEINLTGLVSQIHNLKIFSNEINISVINVSHDIDNEKFSIKIRTWERGVGETLSCGTAACAATVTSIKKGYIPHNSSVYIYSRGGELCVEWQSDDSTIHMTGEAIISFTGQITL